MIAWVSVEIGALKLALKMLIGKRWLAVHIVFGNSQGGDRELYENQKERQPYRAIIDCLHPNH